MQRGVGNTLDREYLDYRVSVAGASRLRVEQFQYLLIQALPKEGFCFEDLEFPSPLWTRYPKSLRVSMRRLLTLDQVATNESAVVVIKQLLRAASRSAREPASKNEKRNAKCYGCVRPLAIAVAAVAAPCPTQPSFILIPVTSK